jgi:acyl-coenzyme A thioesterase PaaI-like protein
MDLDAGIELRRWLQTSTAESLTEWLLEMPDRLGGFSPVAELFHTTITSIDKLTWTISAAHRVQPSVVNPWGHVHGGLLSAAIDEIASICTVLFVGPRAFSGTITNTVNFLSPIRAGEFSITAKLIRKNLTIAAIQADVRGGDTLHATALLLFSLRRDFGLRGI